MHALHVFLVTKIAPGCSTDAWTCLWLQMTRNPGHYGLQLRTSDPAAIKAAIREKFINTALKQLAEHGMVQHGSEVFEHIGAMHCSAHCGLQQSFSLL